MFLSHKGYIKGIANLFYTLRWRNRCSIISSITNYACNYCDVYIVPSDLRSGTNLMCDWGCLLYYPEQRIAKLENLHIISTSNAVSGGWSRSEGAKFSVIGRNSGVWCTFQTRGFGDCSSALCNLWQSTCIRTAQPCRKCSEAFLPDVYGIGTMIILIVSKPYHLLLVYRWSTSHEVCNQRSKQQALQQMDIIRGARSESDQKA